MSMNVTGSPLNIDGKLAAVKAKTVSSDTDDDQTKTLLEQGRIPPQDMMRIIMLAAAKEQADNINGVETELSARTIEVIEDNTLESLAELFSDDPESQVKNIINNQIESTTFTLDLYKNNDGATPSLEGTGNIPTQELSSMLGISEEETIILHTTLMTQAQATKNSKENEIGTESKDKNIPKEDQVLGPASGAVI